MTILKNLIKNANIHPVQRLVYMTKKPLGTNTFKTQLSFITNAASGIEHNDRKTVFAKNKENEHPRIWRSYDDGFIVRNPFKHEIDHIKSLRIKHSLPYPEDLSILYDILESESGIYVGEYKNHFAACFVNAKWGNVYSGALFYVEPKYRCKKFGWRITNDVAMASLTGRSMLLHANSNQMAVKYAGKGWKTRMKTVTYEGEAENLIYHGTKKRCKVLEACSCDFEQLIDYDNRCFVLPNCLLRRKLLKEITFVREGTSYVALNVDNEIIGMGYQRPCAQENLVQIGPLYANSKDVARSILVQLFNDIKGKKYRAYLWEPNMEAQLLFESLGGLKIGEFNRMYVNEDPKEYKSSMYCFTSPDICNF